MASAPIYYVNSPVSATQYWAPMWAGCIPNSSTNATVTVKSWTGANGTGSLIQVTTLTCYLWDQTTNAAKNSNSGNFNTVTASNGTWNGTDWCKPSGKWSGTQSVGSLSLQISTYTGTAFVPTTPTFSPSQGGPGTSVTITGSRFTDATFVNFNGTSASFTVNSDTSITATVPTGATTGPITVGNPGGSSSSASNFTVGNIWVYRSGVWTVGESDGYRSGSPVFITAYGYRSGSWVLCG